MPAPQVALPKLPKGKAMAFRASVRAEVLRGAVLPEDREAFGF